VLPKNGRWDTPEELFAEAASILRFKTRFCEVSTLPATPEIGRTNSGERQRLRSLTLPAAAAEAFASDSSAGAQRIFHVELRGAARVDSHVGYRKCLHEIEKFLCETTLGDSADGVTDGALWGLIDHVTVRLPLPFLRVCALIDAPGFDSDVQAWRNRVTFNCMRATDIGTVVHVIENRSLTSESKRPIEKAQIPQRLASDRIKALFLCWPADKHLNYPTPTTDPERLALGKTIDTDLRTLASIHDWKNWMTLHTGNDHWLSDHQCQLSVCSGARYELVSLLVGELDRFRVKRALQERLEHVASSQLAYECVTKSLQLIRGSLGPYVSLQRIFLSFRDLDKDEIDTCAHDLEEVFKKKAAEALKVMNVIQSVLEAPMYAPSRQPSASSQSSAARPLVGDGFASIKCGLSYAAIQEWESQLLRASELVNLIEEAKTNSTGKYEERRQALATGKDLKAPIDQDPFDSNSNTALGRALKRFAPLR
jgi:hypothetical protein